jgi:hypothetical protein
MSDSFDRLAEYPRGSEPKRIDDILPRVLDEIVRLAGEVEALVERRHHRVEAMTSPESRR